MAIITNNSMGTAVDCPYCHATNHVRAEFWPYKRDSLITCDEENGGCGGRFVISIKFTIASEVTELVNERTKIETNIGW